MTSTSLQIAVPVTSTKRRGARKRSEISKLTLRNLNLGLDETVNLMEWLAVDMDALSCSVFADPNFGGFGQRVRERLPRLTGMGVTARLATIARIIADVAPDPDHQAYQSLSEHRSDIVRQWAVYAIHAIPGLLLDERLARTKRFAADPNMTVRECAWMAFRPHLAVDIDAGVDSLHSWVGSADPNVRRFAIEVTRPRSVWGKHLAALKKEPATCLSLLEPVKADHSRYVRTAVANWLNDASKSQPEWVLSVCDRWRSDRNLRTDWIIGRALRSYRAAAERRGHGRACYR